MDQHVVHVSDVTAFGTTELVKAPEDNPDIPARNSPLCLPFLLVLTRGWFYLSGARIARTRPRLLLRVGQMSYQTI